MKTPSADGWTGTDSSAEPMAAGAGPAARVEFRIRGLIPSFKNSKILVTRNRNGRLLERPLLITKPEYQRRMEEMTESFVSQLLCAFPTKEGATLTGCSLRSAIALSMPADDCWTRLPEIHLKAELCAPGQEGATIILERL